LRIFHEKAALGYHYHPESLETAIARSYQRGLNWQKAFQRMPHAELLIRQRLYDFGTLITRRRELTGERQSYLLGADRSLARLSVNLVLRSILFNQLTVPYFWMPLMHLAERQRFLAGLMVPSFYRGVVVYHFCRACREPHHQSGVAPDCLATGDRGTATGFDTEAGPRSPTEQPRRPVKSDIGKDRSRAG